MPWGSKLFASSMRYLMLRWCSRARVIASPMALASSWCRSPMAFATAAWTCGTRCWLRRFSRSAARRVSTSAITRAKISRARSLVGSGAATGAPGATISVRTGTLAGSGPAAWRRIRPSALPRMSFSFDDTSGLLAALGFDGVHVDIVAALLVEGVARGGELLVGLVGGDDLQQPLEGREEGRPLVREVEEHVVVRQVLAVVGEHDRRLRGERAAGEAVRDELGRLEGPERLVEAVQRRAVGREDHDAARTLVGGRRQAAREAVLVLGVMVKIDARHAARLTRKCDSSGTGRPVAPFSAPDFHAVPAMSRCAHG